MNGLTRGAALKTSSVFTRFGSGRHGDKLQALVYDILPLTTAVFSYAIGSRKLSASNEQFFVGVVSLLQLRLYQTFVQ